MKQKIFATFSEIVLLKQNIGNSGGYSTLPEAKSLNIPLIEVGVL